MTINVRTAGEQSHEFAPLPFYMREQVSAERLALMYGRRVNRSTFTITRFVHLPNRAGAKADYWEAKAADVQEWAELIGIAHTHPGPSQRGPSGHDVAGIGPWLGLVVHPMSGTLTWYDRLGVIIEEEIE